MGSLNINAFLFAVLCAAAARVLADDIKEWAPWIVEKLIRFAVAKLPSAQRDRYGEEWRSHVNDIPGCIAKVIASLGFFFAARQINRSPERSGEAMLRRAYDLLAAGSFLMFQLPLFLTLTILTAFFQGRPVIRRIWVLGEHGKQFELFQFRTKSGNGRVTAFGRFLQKYRFEFLPMMLNVLKGDLSLVGPRPHTRIEAEHAALLNPKYQKRLTVKPGIFWLPPQVSSLSSEVDCDIWYLQNRSLASDIHILLLAIKAVLKGTERGW